MPISGISSSPSIGIDQVLAQIRNAKERAQSPSLQIGSGNAIGSAQGTIGQPGSALNSLRNNALGVSSVQSSSAASAPGSFVSALKASLDQVNTSQVKASELGKSFEKGDPNVDLNDVMVAVQKANVSFQSAVQVRNRLVSAYHDIMNMQI